MTDKSVSAPVTARGRMPTGEEAARVLARRARELLADDASGADPGRELLLCCRSGGGERFGIPYRFLDEVLYARGLRPVPGTPAHIAGIISLRGELPAVLDIDPLFGLPPQTPDPDSPVLMLRADGVRAGLLLREVGGEEPYRPTELECAFVTEGAQHPGFVLGLHDGRMSVIDAQALLHDPMVRVIR